MLDYVDKRLSPDQAASAEGASADGALTKEELLAALKTTLKGKSPGLDGLPYEFYLTFWDAVADALAAAVNEAYTTVDAAPAYDAAFTEGIITLIYKGRPSAPLPEDAVSSYRPITLLNADYKVAAKAVTRRLSRVLGHVVDDTQTAFVPGRWIGDNILCHLDVFFFFWDKSVTLSRGEGAPRDVRGGDCEGGREPRPRGKPLENRGRGKACRGTRGRKLTGCL